LRRIIRRLVPLAIYIVLKIVKVFVIVIGMIVLVSLLAGLIGLVVAILASAGFLVKFVFNSVLPVIVLTVSTILLIGIPLVLLSQTFVRRGFNIRGGRSPRFRKSLGVLWLVSLVAFLITSNTSVASSFGAKATVTEAIPLQATSANILHIKVKDTGSLSKVKKRNNDNIHFDFPLTNLSDATFDYETNKIFIEDVKLDIVQGDGDDFELEQTFTARGGSREAAKEIAAAINYVVEQSDSVLYFEPFYTLPSGQKWRSQLLNLTLKVPVGKAVYLGPKADRVIYDVANTTDTFDGDMVDKTWEMRQEGLTFAGLSNKNTTRENVLIKPLKKGIQFAQARLELAKAELERQETLLQNLPADDEQQKRAARKNIDSLKMALITAENELQQAENKLTTALENVADKLGADDNITATSESNFAWDFETLEGADKKELKVDDFDKIVVAGPFEVEIKRGKHHTVFITGDNDVIQNVDANTYGSTLKFEYDSDWSWLNAKSKETVAKVYVTTPNIKYLEVSGTAKVNASSFSTNTLDVQTSGASTTNIDINVKNLHAETSGAAVLKLSGKAKQTTLSLSGASNVKAYAMTSQKTTVDGSGAASAQITVQQQLKADVSGASSLTYKGQPAKEDISKGVAASIRHIE